MVAIVFNRLDYLSKKQSIAKLKANLHKYRQCTCQIVGFAAVQYILLYVIMVIYIFLTM